ncbi:MAG: YkgJ family cysteine cluster protein [archaeon]|nr:YkgJ family cysteine cluster protein [archaeon]
MALYRGKYVLEGLDEIPTDMIKDLDLAYNTCHSLIDDFPCSMCGKCCHQPFIVIRDEEIDSLAEYVGMKASSFIKNYLHRDSSNGKWFFRYTNPCVFLNKNNKCSIWNGRPEICREFPYLVSMFVSRVYLAITHENYEIDIEYMDDTWPCTKIIKSKIKSMIEEARRKRNF